MRGVFAKTMRDLRNGLFWWSTSLLLTAFLLIYIYPSYSSSMGGIQGIIEATPPALRALYGRFADLTTLEGFLAVEAFNLFMPILFLVYGVLTASSLVGAEEERGTLDLLLAYPLPRWRLLAEKGAAFVVALLILGLATALGYVLGGLAAGVQTDYGRLVAGTLNMLPLTLLFGALAFLVTAAGGGRGVAGGVAGLLATGTYLVDALAPVVRGLEQPSRYLPFYLYGGGLPLKEGVNLGHVGVLLGASAVLAVLGVWAFQRRDVR